MSASRLPGKPLLKINNKSIISHVFRKGEEANIGDVVVATEDQEIFDDVIKSGGRAVLTNSKHKTGTDRIFEAYKKLKLRGVDYILNLQGDEPNINKEDIIKLNNLMINKQLKIGTLAAKIENDLALIDNNIVKVITKNKLENNNFPIALNFIRNNLSKDYKNIYHHIGIYCYKVSVLEKFVNLKQSKNEIEQKLEQLRAIDNKILIDVILANNTPIGVDTEEDFVELKKIMNYKN